jgi:3-phenylpropionate/cinnamic acid dioxygenase small subunit
MTAPANTGTDAGHAPPANRAALREARWEVEEFHYEYAAGLDRGEIEQWPDFFTDDAFYRVVARDNEESGLPLGLIYCEGKGMLRDRAYALVHTETYAPRYLQLRVSNTRVLAADETTIEAEASYLLIETLVDEPSRVQQVGKYHDVFQRVNGSLLIKDRKCVYDTVLIDTCLVFPV